MSDETSIFSVFSHIFFISLLSSMLVLTCTHISYASSTYDDTTILQEGFSPYFELLDRDSGLSNLSVSSIIQDKYGFLWFSTQGGLNLYDGRKITVFRHNPFNDDGLVHNLIQTMYYDEDTHHLWIGTYQGISEMSIHGNSFTNYTTDSHGLSNPIIIAIEKGPDDNMWAGTMDGLNRIDKDSGDITVYDVPGNVIRDLYVDSEGRLLIGTYEGLYQFNFESEMVEIVDLELPSPYVMVVREFHPGTLTLGLWDGGVVNVSMENHSIMHQEYEHNDVYTLYQTHDQTLWIGTWGGGLFAQTPDGSVHHFLGEGENKLLEHPVVYSLHQDHSGILWIGTNGGGINKLNPRQNNYVIHTHEPENPESLSAGKVNAIIRDADENLWVSIYNNGLNRYDPAEDAMISYRHDPNNPASIPSDNIVAMHVDGSGQLLLGSSAGLIAYDASSDSFRHLDYFDDDVFVYAIAEQRHFLWIGTYNHGVYRYNRSTGEIDRFYYGPSYSAIISDNLVYDILVDSKDRVWIGTNNGLNMLRPENDRFIKFHRQPQEDRHLAANTIRVIFEDSKGRIWVGLVGGGLALYQEETGNFKTFLEKDGLSSNIITGILEDSEGRIVAASHDGISVLDPDKEDIIVLTPQDGIGGWEFNAGHYMDIDGSLLFGGVHGITSIPGDLSDVRAVTPIAYITGMELYQHPIDFDQMFFNDQHMNFRAQENFLGFQFSALDYDAPEKTRFSYILEGFDSEWIHAGTRDYAYYSNLPPGSYQLRVVAENVHGVESEPAVFSFTIEKPWYMSGFAIIAYFILFLLLLAGVLRIREDHLVRQRNSMLAALNLQLEEANQQLEKLSTVDPLTGLFNRRYFDTIFEDQFRLSKRSQIPISLLMFDIDHFKNINDTYGHIAGDKVLQEIGRIANDSLPRKTDFLSRYGGDEFAIVLYDTNKEGAIKVARRIQQHAASLTFVEIPDNKATITISIGICSIIPEDKAEPTDLIRTADQALYESKANGRNRITSMNSLKKI
ncbi:MAG: GGDEF domain-containing protein [Tindallia sp. MSAO_Bac2]|nr:MAG: GGDEF domain-containing protein [Tindallia sp. MSAO_Bac2]